MKTDSFCLDEIMEARCHLLKETLRPINVAELEAFKDALFPSADHPWLPLFESVINDPASGTLYHAMAEDRVHVLYCPGKNIGMWFIPGTGKGPLQPEHLKIMRGFVETHGSLLN